MSRLIASFFICAAILFSSAAGAGTILLKKSNTLHFFGAVTKPSVDIAIDSLNKLVQKRRESGRRYPIYILLETPGGVVEEGLRFIKHARSFRGISTIVVTAYSMGAIMSQAFNGRRYTHSKARMMFHEVSVFLMGNYTINFLRGIVRKGIELQNIINRIAARRMRMPEQLFTMLIDNRDWFLSSEEMLAFNAVDRIVELECSKSLSETEFLELSPKGAILSKIKTCPLDRLKESK